MAFSQDCDNIQTNDAKLKRQIDGTFELLDTYSFDSPGKYYFCWKSPLTNYDGYIMASDSYWLVKDIPKIPDEMVNKFFFNLKIEIIVLDSEIGRNDEVELFSGSVDCDISNKEDGLKIGFNKYNLYIWLPKIL